MAPTERMSSLPCSLTASLILHVAPQRGKGSTSETDSREGQLLAQSGHSRLTSVNTGEGTCVRESNDHFVAANITTRAFVPKTPDSSRKKAPGGSGLVSIFEWLLVHVVHLRRYSPKGERSPPAPDRWAASLLPLVRQSAEHRDDRWLGLADRRQQIIALPTAAERLVQQDELQCDGLLGDDPLVLLHV